MKKYLMYLGFLLVLFSTPQVANAADLYLRGDTNIKRNNTSAAWNNPSDTWKFTESNGVYTLTGVTIPANVGFKIGQASTWDSSWGGKQISPNTLVTGLANNNPSVNFTLSKDVTNATITLDTNKKTILVSTVSNEDLGLYLRGGFSLDSDNNWDANPDWKFTWLGNNEYRLIVPYDTWKASHEFKISDASWSSGHKWGFDKHGTLPLKLNQEYNLTKNDNDGDLQNIKMEKDVSKGDVVTFNSSTGAFKVSHVEVADPNWFEIQPGDMYLVGNHLNNWRSTPEYRLMEKVPGSGEYVLEDFLIVKNAEFVVRVWSDNNNYTDYLVKPEGNTWDYYSKNFNSPEFPKDSYQNMQSDATGKRMKWCSGSTLFSVRVKVDGSGKPSQFKLEPNFYYPSRDAEWPSGTTDVKGNKPVFGIPWLAFIGGMLKQDYSATTPNNGRNFGGESYSGNTGNGWQGSWVQTFNGKPIYYKTVPGKDNKGEQNGDVLYNTIWPPRENIMFNNGDISTSSNAISFKPDRGGIFGKKLSRAEAIKELKGAETTAKFIKDYAGDSPVYGSETDIPDGATWTKYATSNVTVDGSFKLWSGWGGALVGDDTEASKNASANDKAGALWSYHPNWGLGTYDSENPDKYVPVSSNNIYEAHVSQIGNNGVAGANMHYSQRVTFREFNFYVARTETGDLHYYFVARLDAGDPNVAISKRADNGITGTMEILNPDNNTTYRVTGYKLYLSDDGGTTWGEPVKEGTFANPYKTIGEFNTWAQDNIHASDANLPTGIYQYRLDVDYVRGVTSTGYSDQITIANGVKVNLTASQLTEGTDASLKYAFGVSLNGGIDANTPAQIAEKVDHYKLTIEDEFSTLTYGTETVNYESGTQTYTIGKDANGKFPEVIAHDMAPGAHKFRLEAVFATDADIDPAMSTPVTATVIAPASYLVFGTDAFGFDNNIGVSDEAGFLSQNVDALREAKNWVVANGEIAAPAVTASVTDKYNISYKVIYDGNALDGEIASAGANTDIKVDNLPYTGSLTDGSMGDAKYNFALVTVYTSKTDGNKRYESEQAETAEQILAATELPAPRNNDQDRTYEGDKDHITIFESYAERFYGLHAYWQDAFVALKLDNKPLKGGLVGSLKQETVNNITGVAPIEAGGNYAFGKLLTESNITGLWYQSWTEKPSDCEHYDGMTGVGYDSDRHVIAAPFFAGTGETGHDPRNQYFCMVDHHNDPAAKGFGTVTKAEAEEFFKNENGDSWKPSDLDNANDEMIWYKDGRIYRKVHHVNHEARYFGDGTAYEAHSNWAFDYSQYQPIQATLRYQYKVLTSAGSVIATAVTTPQSAPRRAIAKVPAEGATYGEAVSGSIETVSLQGAEQYSGTTGIGSVGYDGDNAPVEYYNLQGVKVDNPVPGNVYIFRQGSRSGKVLIK